MRLAISGSRTIKNLTWVRESMQEFIAVTLPRMDLSCGSKVTEIIHGGASGVDMLAEQISRELYLPTTIHRPDWRLEPRVAPKYRNLDILRGADCLLALWDGLSGGTAHTVAVAGYLEVPTHVKLYSTPFSLRIMQGDLL